MISSDTIKKTLFFDIETTTKHGMSIVRPNPTAQKTLKIKFL